MKKIQGSYAMYFKSKYKKTGLIIRGQPLFEGRFKAKPIYDKKYLAQCIAYVSFNPIKHEIVKDIDNYLYTSYHQIKKKDNVVKRKDLKLDDLEL